MSDPLAQLLLQLDPGGRVTWVAALVALRLAPLTALAPWLGLRGAPATLRAALLVALTVATTPIALAAAPTLPTDLLSLVAIATREVALGTVLAIGTSIPLHALDQSGRLIDTMRGAAQAESTTPSGERSSSLGALAVTLGATLFLALGGHRVVVSAIAETFLAAPIGGSIAVANVQELALGAGRLVASSLTLAVSFAAPAIVALVAAELALGVVARAAPQIPVHFAGMPLRAAVGLGAVLLSLAVLLPQLPSAFRAAIDATARLIGSTT